MRNLFFYASKSDAKRDTPEEYHTPAIFLRNKEKRINKIVSTGWQEMAFCKRIVVALSGE